MKKKKQKSVSTTLEANSMNLDKEIWDTSSLTQKEKIKLWLEESDKEKEPLTIWSIKKKPPKLILAG